MELKEANYILAIAKYKSISKAADALYISQPSLSKYLKNLESSLGTRLFNRIDNSYVPTYVGERYLHYAGQITSLGNEWATEFDDIMHTGQGRLTISLPIMLSNCIIHPTMPKFHRLHPNVTLNLMEEVHFVAENSLKDPSIDMTLYNVHEFPKNMDYSILKEEEIVMVIKKDNPLVKKAINKKGFRHPWIDLSLFENENFILLYPDQNTGGVAASLFEEYGITPKVLMRTRNSEMSIRLAIEGTGISFAPESYYSYLVKQYPGISTCLSIGRSRISTTLIAAHQKNRYVPQYAEDYKNLIIKYFQ